MENTDTRPEQVTAEMIEQWKKTYGDNIYMVDISGETFIYRGLMRAEFKTVAKQANMIANQVDSNMYMEEQNVIIGSIYPKIVNENINSFKAGIITILSGNIMDASGFDDTATPVKL